MTPAHRKKLEKASREEVQDLINAGIFHDDAIRETIKSFEKALNSKSQTPDYYKEYKYAIAYLKTLLIKKPKKMATKKKATPAQLAARKKFTQMAKDGTLAKKRKAAAEKGLNNSLPKGMTKSVAKAIKVTGLKKADGTLQKGFKYLKGGKIVKAKASKK